MRVIAVCGSLEKTVLVKESADTAFPAVVCGLAGNHGLEEKDPLLELPTLEADDDLTTPTAVVRLGSSD